VRGAVDYRSRAGPVARVRSTQIAFYGSDANTGSYSDQVGLREARTAKLRNGRKAGDIPGMTDPHRRRLLEHSASRDWDTVAAVSTARTSASRNGSCRNSPAWPHEPERGTLRPRAASGHRGPPALGTLDDRDVSSVEAGWYERLSTVGGRDLRVATAGTRPTNSEEQRTDEANGADDHQE